jgi:hypothetical protein
MEKGTPVIQQFHQPDSTKKKVGCSFDRWCVSLVLAGAGDRRGVAGGDCNVNDGVNYGQERPLLSCHASSWPPNTYGLLIHNVLVC